MIMPKTTETGRIGERAALEMLTAKGMHFLSSNYRYGHYEIDLIMKDGDYIVFTEVKARSRTDYALPREFVDKRKQLRLIAAAENYLLKNGLSDVPVRFDVVEVYLEAGKIHHIRDAFRPD